MFKEKTDYISVVLACYNAENTIVETLESINGQTHREFECIIINDGSTDDTLNIIDSYIFREGIEKIVISRQNKGFIRSLVDGINKSSGDIIARIDADDIWEKDHLAKLSDILIKEDLCLIGSNATIIDIDGKIIGETNVPLTECKIRKEFLNDNPYIHSSVIFRKSIYSKTSGYMLGEGDFYKHIADYNLWLEMSFYGHCGNMKEKTLRYRIQAASMSRNINKYVNYKARCYVMRKAYNHYHNHFFFFIYNLAKVSIRLLQNR